MLVYNNLITWSDDENILLELKFLKVENGKITHDAYGKDRADAIAASAWTATGEVLSLTQQLDEARAEASLSHVAVQDRPARRAHTLGAWGHFTESASIRASRLKFAAS